MKVYLVGLALVPVLAEFVSKNYSEFGVLISYFYPNGMNTARKNGLDILMDSGAYSAYKKGKEIDIDAYCEFIEKNKTDFTISLDVIGNGEKSIENWEYMKGKTGVDLLPVYHVGSDMSVLDYYADRANYICIGGFAAFKLSVSKYCSLLHPIFERHPNKKFHALGVSNKNVLNRFPFYSCDFLSWRVGANYGNLLTPNGSIFLGNKRKVNRTEEEELYLKELLNNEYGLEYPFPDDFDYRELDKLNIKFVYESLVVNRAFDDMAINVSLF